MVGLFYIVNQCGSGGGMEYDRQLVKCALCIWFLIGAYCRLKFI